MPGLVGLITKMPRERAEAELRRMVATMLHESFYVSGMSVDEASGVYVGWVARKGSFSDSAPVKNERGDAVLVFSGEEFPDPHTSQRLRERGHRFSDGGPEYLIHLYEDESDGQSGGDDNAPARFLAGLNGKFHGLLTDARRGTTTLLNDRYGMHRLYYHEARDAFYFAAEAKAILAVRPELRAIDPVALGQFVACGCVMQNRSLFPGIAVLPGGASWRFRKGALEAKASYFQPKEWEEQAPLDSETYYAELRSALERNLPRYFAGSEPIGMSLTGGMDTRMIMAWHKAPPHSLPCYTYGGMYRDCQDVLRARKVAAICEQPHQVIRTGDEFLANFGRYAERSVYLTDGCVDLTRSPDLYVSEKAREIAPIKIVGTYGSEIIRQAAMFKPMLPRPGLFRAEFVSYVRQTWPVYAEIRNEHPVTFAAFRQAPWQHYGVLSLENTQVGVRSPYLDNDFVRTVYRAPKPPASANGNGHHAISNKDDIRLRLIADGNPALGRLLSDRGVGQGLSSIVYGGLLEFTFKAEYAYDYGMPQWLSRVDHAFSALHFERMFLGRHKLFHFRVWYRGALAKYVEETLLDPRTLARAYLEPKALQAVVRGHLREGRNYTSEIHRLLTLELMHRLFIDAN